MSDISSGDVPPSLSYDGISLLLLLVAALCLWNSRGFASLINELLSILISSGESLRSTGNLYLLELAILEDRSSLPMLSLPLGGTCIARGGFLPVCAQADSVGKVRDLVAHLMRFQ